MARFGFLTLLAALCFGNVPPGHAEAVIVEGGSAADVARIEVAIGRFQAAGLTLPAVRVVFHDDLTPCQGHLGLFQTDGESSLVHICDREADFVYEHELAHVWIFENVDINMRQDLQELFHSESWADAEQPWNSRCVELAAVAIQQGLSGLPLPPTIPEKLLERTRAYTLMTGAISPQYAQWQDLFE